MTKAKLCKRVELLIDQRGIDMANDLWQQFNRLHQLNFFPRYDVEKELVDNQIKVVDQLRTKTDRPHKICFSPSGASKCKRELFYKMKGEEAREDDRFPYHRRWTRNAGAVHGAVQRDLLYCEKLLENPSYKVHRLDNGDIAWEELLKNHKIINYGGEEFAILGMMDGILEHKDGALVGFEFKTKSTTIAACGDYLMKGIKDEHKLQCVAYSILFGLDDFVVMYESVAKDGWFKNENAKIDYRTFYYKVTDTDREDLLSKFADVTSAVNENVLPPKEEDKCIFCPYKYLCKEVD